jgi:type VI secretion system protein
MALTLRVTSFHSQALGADSTRVFGAQGGAIGRALDNDWVLPDPEKFVSSHHAQILCRGGTYALKDVSTNGTFVNGSPQPVGNGLEQQLFDGDRIQIGDYAIAVALDVSVQQGATGPTGPAAPGVTGPGGITGSTGPYGATPAAGSDDDILGLFDDAPVTAPPAPLAPTPDHASALDQNFVPPTPQQAPPSDTNVIPDDWDVTGFASPEDVAAEISGTFNQPPRQAAPPQPASHQPTPPPAPATAAPGAAGTQAVVAMLMAAGLDQANAQAAVTPQNLAALGQILGVTTQGLIDVLAARSAVKSQFRVAMTMMRPVENNALKSSANATEALLYLLVNQNPAYLSAADSFAEGFEDIKAHQMAMMAGMRAAFDSMLQRFDPKELGQRFEKRKAKSMLRLSSSGQYWDMYKDLYDDMTQDADANFQRLFGEEFARAYEEQMQRLTAGRGRPKV